MLFKCFFDWLPSFKKWSNPLDGIHQSNFGLTDEEMELVSKGKFNTIQMNFCISCGKEKQFNTFEQCRNCYMHSLRIRAFNPLTSEKLVDIGGRVYYYKEKQFLRLVQERL